jgi:hypothetical protein
MGDIKTGKQNAYNSNHPKNYKLNKVNSTNSTKIKFHFDKNEFLSNHLGSRLLLCFPSISHGQSAKAAKAALQNCCGW